ncbi:hypothetical protein [Solibacillus isronensis]|uniref:hypothetical protein n=2 Tax=Caryophanaceae TaxID=186818 RepID=UPI0007FB27D7|nr:hypothetical protein A9986_14400 [Solibacillus silvestris]
MMKKSKFTLSTVLSLILVFSFVLTASAAYSKIDCSNVAGNPCKGVNVTSYGSGTVYSETLYATAGDYLEVSNYSSGQFNLVTTLVDSSGNAVSEPIPFTDTQYIKVEKAGYYGVKVECEDDSVKKRCTGTGKVINS